MDYEEFRSAAHGAYRQIADASPSTHGFIRIGELRRAMGDSISKEVFDEHLLRLDRERVVSLMRGAAAGLTEEQRLGGVEDPKAGLLLFVHWLHAKPR